MIISGVFTELFKTKFGGRHGYFKQRYFQGLVNLGGNTQKKVVYVKPEDMDKLVEVLTNNLTEEEYKRYTLIPFDLNDQTYSERILELREKYGYLNDRCLHVQYGKFQWLLNHMDEDDYVWWIDAGLVCDHLFPTEYVKNIGGPKNVFSDEYFEYVKDKTGEKCYFICGDRHRYYAHGKPNKIFFDSNHQDRYHPIGGFFGGKNDSLKEFLNVANNKIEKVLNEEVLYSEEIIMEIVFSEKKETCVFDDFTTWRHEQSPDYIKGDEKYKDLFHREHKPFYCNFFENEVCRNSKVCN